MTPGRLSLFLNSLDESASSQFIIAATYRRVMWGLRAKAAGARRTDEATALMAVRQRRARESDDRRPELRLSATACGRLFAEYNRLGASHVTFRFARGCGLEPPTVDVRAMAGVLIVSGIPGCALTGMFFGSVGGHTDQFGARLVTVRNVELRVLAGAIGLGQLLVRGVAVVRVGKKSFGGIQSEAQREYARGQAAEEFAGKTHYSKYIHLEAERTDWDPNISVRN